MKTSVCVYVWLWVVGWLAGWLHMCTPALREDRGQNEGEIQQRLFYIILFYNNLSCLSFTMKKKQQLNHIYFHTALTGLVYINGNITNITNITFVGFFLIFSLLGKISTFLLCLFLHLIQRQHDGCVVVLLPHSYTFQINKEGSFFSSSFVVKYILKHVASLTECRNYMLHNLNKLHFRAPVTQCVFW